mgnify:CR=1 FL=1
MRQARRRSGVFGGLVGLWLALLMAMPAAYAQRVEGDRAAASGIYEGEVPVNNQTDAERNNGFARALAQVLAKISGDRSATGRPGVGQELRRAKEFVSGYDYRQDQGVSATGAPPCSPSRWWPANSRRRSSASANRSGCRSASARRPTSPT